MKYAVFGFTMLAANTAAHADYYGLANGRTADLRGEPQTTIGFGMSTEDDRSNIGGRFNFKLSSDSLFYATLTSIDSDNTEDDIAFGGGVVFQLKQNTASNVNIAVKGSYHLLSTETVLNRDADYSDFGIELIVSPKRQTVAQGVGLFASFGFHRLSSEIDRGFFGDLENTETEFSFGAGATFAAGPGEAYVAMENIDDTFIGFGYRLALGQ